MTHSPHPSLLNTDYLRTAFGDDPAFIQELLQVYVADARARLVALQQAMAAGDWETLQREAHQLKGASANVGVTAVQDLARTLEETAKAQPEPAQMQVLLQTLTQWVQQLEQEMQDLQVTP